MIPIQERQRKHQEFKKDSETKIRFFIEGGYNAIPEDLENRFVQKDFVRIVKRYRMLKFLQDLYNHDYIEFLRKYDEENGFTTDQFILDKHKPEILAQFGSFSELKHILEHQLSGFHLRRWEEESQCTWSNVVPLFKLQIDDELTLKISV